MPKPVIVILFECNGIFLAEEIFPDLVAKFVQANLNFFNLFVKPLIDDFFDGGERNVGTQLS